MPDYNSSLARTLDFGEGAATAGLRVRSGSVLRLARPGRPGGPDKYKRLAARRRRAQIRARHLLDLLDQLDRADAPGEGAR